MRCRALGELVAPGDQVTEVTTVGTPTHELFVAYRQSDSSGHTGRVGEHLMRHFGPGQVFKDRESLRPGEDFRSVVRKRLGTAFAMVVVIGPTWSADARLKDEGDLHREEIRTALQRGIHTVPVLVNNARVPNRSDLPDDLLALLDRQAVEITDNRWNYDMGILIENLEVILEQSPARKRFLAQVPPWGHRGAQWVTDNPTDQDLS